MDEFQVGDPLETGVEERDLLDLETIDSIWSVDVDAIANIVRMLDEEKDAGSKELLCCY